MRHFPLPFRSGLRSALFVSALLSSAIAHADWNVSVGTTSSNGAWSGANPDVWTPSATGATVSATEIRTRLNAGKPVVITTAGGGAEAGNLDVNSAVTWSASTLTLHAANNITVKAAMNGSSSAGLALEYGQGAVAAGNAATYGVNAAVDLASTGSFSTKLGSDGGTIAYTILTSLGAAGSTTGTDLQGINGNLAGNYVLGTDIDASGTSGWNGGQGFAPIGTLVAKFTGSFDGLGHVVGKLTISRSGTDYVGLFGDASGAIRNIGLDGGSVTGRNYVGALAGYSRQQGISNAWASANVSGTNDVGGLVGYNLGTTGSKITHAYATGSVTGNNYVGGLAGYNESFAIVITNTWASGKVTGAGGFTGGLAGGDSNGSGIGTSYWDSGTTNQADGCRSNTTCGGGATGLATANAFSAANYANLDGGFTCSTSICTSAGGNWVMFDGSTRPFLKSEYRTTVTNSHQLQLMALDLAASYTLGRNVDASETGAGAAASSNKSGMWNSLGFVPVGRDAATPFTGNFDGLNHTISGLKIDLSGGNNRDYGLFGTANNAVLQNVGLLNVDIYGGANGNTGALAGQTRGTTSVLNSYVDGGNVRTATLVVGGLVGVINAAGASVGHSYANVSVSADLGGGSPAANAGGLAGANNGAISYSYATGSVSAATGNSAAKYIGGLVGAQNSGPGIDHSYATGAVSGNNTLGGLVGNLAGGTAPTSSYWDKTTTGQNTSSGGGTGLATSEWATLGPFGSSPSGGAWNVSDWQSGSPYPGVKVLPYITITASASQTFGSAATIGIASILDQNGANASSLVNTSGLTWQSSTTSSSPVGTVGTISGKGAVATGYQILYTGTVTVAAAAPASSAEPSLISAGPGSTVTLSGTTPVTASPGSTLVIPAGANVAGIAITLAAPSGGGEAGPITFKIGGLTLTLSGYSPGTVVSFKKVMVNGVETLVLVVNSGSLSLSGAAGQPLLTLNGSATLTAGTDGTALSFSAGNDGSGSIAVSKGYIVLSANAFAASNGFTAIKDGRLYAGEVASFNAAGKISGAHLGSLDGSAGQLGDSLGPLNGVVPTPKVNLQGRAARLGSDGEFTTALAAALGQGFSSAGQNGDGVLRVNYPGGSLNAVPLGTLAIDTERSDGVTLRSDGLIEISVGGIVATFAPALPSLADLLVALPKGATAQSSAEGVLTVTFAGKTYYLRPAWVAAPGGTAGFSMAQGGVAFDDGKDSYPLHPAFANYALLCAKAVLEIPGATCRANLDGSVALTTASGQGYTLTARLEQGAPGVNAFNRLMSGQRWWQEADGRLFLNAGAVQEFEVK